MVKCLGINIFYLDVCNDTGDTLMKVNNKPKYKGFAKPPKKQNGLKKNVYSRKEQEKAIKMRTMREQIMIYPDSKVVDCVIKQWKDKVGQFYYTGQRVEKKWVDDQLCYAKLEVGAVYDVVQDGKYVWKIVKKREKEVIATTPDTEAIKECPANQELFKLL